MGPHYHHNIGAHVRTKRAVSPQAASEAVNGTVIDRDGFGSCQLAVTTGAASGSPTGISVAAKLQHSDTDDGNGMEDFDDVVIEPVTAINSEARVNADLAGAKRYVRVVVTPTLTGGSSPEVEVAAVLVLGGATELPA